MDVSESSTPSIRPVEQNIFNAIFHEQICPFELQHQVQTAFVNDFKLESGEVVERAAVSFCVYGEHHPSKRLVLLHPALTGSARAMLLNNGAVANQGDGWWSSVIGPGKGFDTDNYTFVCFDHFGGHYGACTAEDLSRQGLHGKATLADGVNLIVQFLVEQGIESVYAVVGGSLGGGQAMKWLFQDRIDVGRIVDVSGCTAMSRNSREFFSIPADVLDKEVLLENRISLPQRYLNHVKDLQSFDSAITNRLIIKLHAELNDLISDYSETQALAWARKFGFLRFVTPKFFEEKYSRYLNSQAGQADAQEKASLAVESWLDNKGDDFVQRFSSAGLQNICRMVADSPEIKPADLAARLLAKDSKIVSFFVKGDVLFPPEEQYPLYHASRSMACEDRVFTIETTDEVSGHDLFLNPQFSVFVPALMDDL